MGVADTSDPSVREDADTSPEDGGGEEEDLTMAAAKKPSVPCCRGESRRKGVSAFCAGGSVPTASGHSAATGTISNSGWRCRKASIWRSFSAGNTEQVAYLPFTPAANGGVQIGNPAIVETLIKKAKGRHEFLIRAVRPGRTAILLRDDQGKLRARYLISIEP